MDDLKRLDIPELQKLYDEVESLRSNELVAAEKETKASLTRMRKHLSNIQKLCMKVRKQVLEIRENG